MKQVTVCFVIPTRDRGGDLARTLTAIGRLDVSHGLSAEVLVIDNGSEAPALVPGSLANGIPVQLECLAFNEGTGARNRVIGATDADWILMLDDDSFPVDAGFVDALREADDGVSAISADIHLPATGTREMGGLPEVFIGCGVAVRRDAFESLGGYDASFGYYAEEYDLAARILLDGGSVRFDSRFRVDHMKSVVGRDMNVILERLVRNNGWVMQRYAPDDVRREQLREIRHRCRTIASRENARAGFSRGLKDLRRTIGAQQRHAMNPVLFDRFTGLAAARAAISKAHAEQSFDTAYIVDSGKNAWCVVESLRSCGVRMVDTRDADVLVIGTMSPGPMIDAAERWASVHENRPVIAPWLEPSRSARENSGMPQLR